MSGAARPPEGSASSLGAMAAERPEGGSAGSVLASYEALVSREPVVVRKRVRWADCDPAGVVYTGKFSEYLLLAVNYFFDEIGQGNYGRWLKSLQVDTPCKGMDLTFHAALWPEDEFDMTCTVAEIRDHSYDIRVEAAQTGGRRVFTGRFSPICISREARHRVPIPDAMLQSLQRHRLAHTTTTATTATTATTTATTTESPTP